MSADETFTLDGRLTLPARTRFIFWDMDGVLVDSCGADYDLCVRTAAEVVGDGTWIRAETIRENFALASPAFWACLVRDSPRPVDTSHLPALVALYDKLRESTRFAVLPGIREMLAECVRRGIRCAVVSSNPRPVVESIIKDAGLPPFPALSTLGDPAVKAKPAPDLYLHALRLLGARPEDSAFIEDSLTGLAAGRQAGIATAIAVATGALPFEQHVAAGLADAVYRRFERPAVALRPGVPAEKKFDTPNDFVSHMVEHIAWRLGVGIDLTWWSNDWRALGKFLGNELRTLGFRRPGAATLGMIDDGAAEVSIAFDRPAGVVLETHPSIARSDLLGLRVEQVARGEELLRLLEGLAAGLGACIEVLVCSLEDAHHTWEGVFRAVGIALARLRDGAPPRPATTSERPAKSVLSDKHGHILIEHDQARGVSVERATAESRVRVRVAASDAPTSTATFRVAPSIDVSAFPALLDRFSAASGFEIAVDFSATRLSSSHVVLEDTGLTLGTALFEMLRRRMETEGVEGAGSSLRTREQIASAGVGAAISVEGRKFLKFATAEPHDLYRRRLVLGHSAFGGIRTEDIDDFLDALAGGLRASVFVHQRRPYAAPDEYWQDAIVAVGSALQEVFAPNPDRRGLPPGVKATLL
ncbi:MAG: HAD-IA family hydrolase [Hyphomicrobiaceae bacterium]